MKRAMKAAAEALALEVGGRRQDAGGLLFPAEFNVQRHRPKMSKPVLSVNYSHQTHLSTHTLSPLLFFFYSISLTYLEEFGVEAVTQRTASAGKTLLPN
jgi:hypothetical protein